MANGSYPVDVRATRPTESSRGWALLLVLFGLKAFALILQFIIAFIWGIGVFVLFFVSQLVVVFTAKYPEGMHAFIRRFIAWANELNGWLSGLTDDYPPFTPTDEPYAVTTTIEQPDESSRLWAVLTIFWLKPFALIPHLIVLYVLQLVQGVLVWIANLIIVFTGEFPEGFFGFIVGVIRWQTRVSAFFLGLVDEYPPFSLE
jgi:hypothetical protein